MAIDIPELTLYTSKICPWAQRATLALAEVGSHTKYVEIDLQNKPDWYASKVNPASKVPVLQVGKDETSPKIPESHVILELVADLYKDVHPLLPTDPVLRAEARYFIERFNQVVSGPQNALVYQRDASAGPKLLAGVKEIQGLLKRRPGQFLLGDDVTIGDLGVLPFIGRILTLAASGIAPNDAYKSLLTDPEYQPFRDYAEALTSRPSFKATFPADLILDGFKKRLAATA